MGVDSQGVGITAVGEQVDLSSSTLLELAKTSPAEHLQYVRARIAEGGHVDQYDPLAGDLYTPLHWAAVNGHVGIAGLLIDAGADLEKRNSNAMTPLLLATQNGQEELAAVLLEHGADVN